MKKKLLALMLCVSMAVTGLAGCSSSDGNIALSMEEEQIEITFSWWGSDDRHEYTIAAVKKFEEEHPNIKVNMEYSEFTGFQLKTDVKMRANKEADVLQINYAWVDRYSEDGTGLYNLNNVKDVLNLSNYTETQLSYGMSDNVLNALPIALNGKVFLYNKSIFDSYGLDIPNTWEDLFEAAEVMSKDGVYPLDLESSAIWFLAVSYVEQSTGKAVIDEDNKFNFSLEDVKAMISFYKELVDKGVVMEVSERNDSYIKDGTCAGTLQWITSVNKYSGFIEEAGGEAVLGQVPVMNGAKRTGWYVKPATMYAISASTEHPKEAALLLEYLVSSTEMAKLQGLDKGIPSNAAAKQVLESEGMLEGLQGEASEVVDATDTILMSPYFENSALQNALKNAVIDVLYEKSDIDSAAKTAYEAMVEDLN